MLPEILLVPLPGRKWRIPVGYVVWTSAYGWVHIPSDFVCDLNSIPRFLWWASTPTDYPQAGATHDFLYDQQIPQEIADAVYLELLLASGMGKFRANARYRALRMVGGIAYRKHAK